VEDKKKNWGQQVLTLDEVAAVFVAYVSGKIKKFPFSEGSLALETADINDDLVKMNTNKLLTINSQPRVNGVKSSDAKYGWGPENGYIYQKAYFELFVPAAIVPKLAEYLNKHQDITY